MTGRDVPSDEDFARARAAMRERDRGLSQTSSNVLERFGNDGLHEVFVMFSPKNRTFVAHLFFRWDVQISKAMESGLAGQIQMAVIEELVRIGRGTKETLEVSFDYDSHENVEKNFEGDYFLRLR